MKSQHRVRDTSSKLLASAVVSLMLVLPLVLSVTPTFETQTCVCGTKSILLVLAEFPEYRHLSGRQEIANLFFGRVASYFYDVSYGQLTVTGNATDWTTLPLLYEQYQQSERQMDIMAIARDAFTAASKSYTISQFDEIFLVLSFYPSLTTDFIDASKQPIVTGTGAVNSFSVVEENLDWSTYAHGIALLIGLWRYRSELSGLGSFDLAARGDGDLTSWSKLTLGWINESQTLSLVTPVTSRLLKVNSIETGPGGPLVLRMELTNGEYLIEVRQQIGYDLNSLPEYGATVLYVPPGNAPIVVKKVLRPDDLDRAVFIDANADLAVVALNQTQTSFWFLVGEAQDGRDALATLHAISEASHSIDMAISENRILNLDLAKRLLDNARTLMGLARFRQATALALSAETTANAATVPSDYYDALQLINRAEQLKNKTSTITFTQSSQGWTLAVLGASQLAVAKAAFQAKNFTVARESAQESIDSFNRADQIQLNETIMSWLSNLIIVIAAVIMAYALRYQLKNA